MSKSNDQKIQDTTKFYDSLYDHRKLEPVQFDDGAHGYSVSFPKKPSCIFCKIIAGEAPKQLVAEWTDTIAIVPLNPVTKGHILVIPKEHIKSAADDPDITGRTMERAAMMAVGSANIIINKGAAATQTVMHLHIHVIPRRPGDGLILPWTNQEKSDV